MWDFRACQLALELQFCYNALTIWLPLPLHMDTAAFFLICLVVCMSPIPPYRCSAFPNGMFRFFFIFQFFSSSFQSKLQNCQNKGWSSYSLPLGILSLLYFLDIFLKSFRLKFVIIANILHLSERCWYMKTIEIYSFMFCHMGKWYSCRNFLQVIYYYLAAGNNLLQETDYFPKKLKTCTLLL